MSQVPPSNDSFYGSQPYGQGSPYSGSSAPSAPYADQQNAMPPAYGGNNPHNESFSYTGSPVPAPKGKKGPVILLSIALVMVIGAVAVFIGSVVMVANISGTLTPVKPNGEVTADLKGSSIYALYSDGDPSCTVTAPNGSDVAVLDVSASNTKIDGHTMVATFSTEQDGKHTINCTTPGSEDVSIGQALDSDGIVNGVLGMGVAIILAVVGVPMLIGAIIWLVVRLSYNRKARQAQAAMGGGYPGGQQQY
jgi:hypothetical protein avisC_03885